MKIKLLTLVIFVLSINVNINAQIFKAGASLRIITPDYLIPISGGMGEPEMPTGKKGDLFVRVLVLEKGPTRIAIVSIDNIGWPAALGDRSRKLIKGVAPENVLIGVTHTHSAPDAYGFPDENGNTKADLKYLDWCVIKIADAVNEAVAKLEPASLKTVVGEAKGKIAYNYYAEKLYDPRCGVIQVSAVTGNNKGKTIATLVNYAIHPEILGPDRKLMSPDLCGPLYERIESKTGGMAIFLNSAQGGMVTADNRLENGKEANDWDECIRIGNLLADEALRLIESAPLQENPDIFCASKVIRFPVDSEIMRFVFKNSPVLNKSGNNDDFSTISTRLNLLNIGKAQVITIPGEALPNIGFYLKRKMKSDQPFLFGLTNDAFGYMMTREDFGSFDRYKYVSRTSLGEMTGAIYEEEALKFISECPAPNDTGPSISIPSLLLDNQKPVANWIWDSGPDNPRNYYLMIRKTVDLNQIPIDVNAYISAYSYADVYINGKLVDRCPMNCDPEFQVYEKYNLTGYFRKGKNTISALVYNFGIGMHHRINARGGFFFQASLKSAKDDILEINTDNSWRVSKAIAWDNLTETRTASTNLIGFIEKFDARRMTGNWKENSYDDSQWEPAKIIGIPPVAPWNNIVVINRPKLFREQVYPVNHWFVGDKIVYDFGKEIAGTPVLELYSGRDGVSLEMGTSERLLPDRSALYNQRVNYTDFYICKKGFQSWSPLTWRGFRYLSLSQKDSLIIKGISAINRHYDFTREGSFESSDPLLNQIWEVGNQTVLLCAQDTYMDTPWREQTQYIAGDSRYLQKYAFYSFGLSSELLTRYNILSGAWSQRWKEDGSIRSRYPTDWLLGKNTSAYLADYELEWIIMLGEYYQYFGKSDLVKQVYPNMKKLLTHFKNYIGKEHGLLSNVPGWIVLDHPDTYPMDQREEITGLNCLYYGALKQAAYIAQNIISDPVQAANWATQARQIKENILKWFWSPGKHLFIDSYGSEKCSQQTQVYALYYGLAEDAEKKHVIDVIAADNRSSEQSFSYYVLDLMFDSRPQWALDFIRKNWGDQMKSPFFNGAWHEAWDIEHWTTDLGSTSHAWCSGPTALLPQKVLGVEPISAGWQTFSVRPHPCDLKWAKGSVPSPYGTISVDWKVINNSDFRLYVRIPENTNAEISVPGSDPYKIKINDQPVNSCPGIKTAEIKNGWIVLKATTGEYQILSINNK